MTKRLTIQLKLWRAWERWPDDDPAEVAVRVLKNEMGRIEWAAASDHTRVLDLLESHDRA